MTEEEDRPFCLRHDSPLIGNPREGKPLEEIDDPEDRLDCELLRAAYPEGVPEQDWYALLAIVYSVLMSLRVTALTVQDAFGVNYSRAYQDTGPEAKPADLARVIARLRPNGLDSWLSKRPGQLPEPE